MTQGKTTMLSADQERALFDAYLDGGDISARNRIITAYMPFAIRAAEAFARRGTARQDDLIQEAALALSQAVDHFNRDLGARVATLARYYIKAALVRHSMSFDGAVRVGTNKSDKKVFLNLRRMVSELKTRTGGAPITDADREAMATALNVRVEAIRRMEPRIFSSDVAIDIDDRGQSQRKTGFLGGHLAVESDERHADARMDQQRVMERVLAIVRETFGERDLDIVQERLKGPMTRPRYDALVAKYGITVERVRQIQRRALAGIRDQLAEEGITGLAMIAH